MIRQAVERLHALFYEPAMKHTFLFLFILGLGINIHAEEKQSIFFLYSMDNFQTEPQQIGISLFDSPKLKFNDGLLEISYNNNSLTFEEEFIYNFSYSSTPASTAIQTPNVTKKISIELKENTIMLRDLLPNTRLYAYTLEGKVVKKISSDSQGTADVSLPSGVYIIKVQEQQFKISIK